MGGNYLKGRDGDRINAVLGAAGYNFSLLRGVSRCGGPR
jgi:transposase, IS5 family